jgi:hypothetical protein
MTGKLQLEDTPVEVPQEPQNLDFEEREQAAIEATDSKPEMAAEPIRVAIVLGDEPAPESSPEASGEEDFLS